MVLGMTSQPNDQYTDPRPVPDERDYVSAVDRIAAIVSAATFLTQRCDDFPAPDRITVARDITQEDEIDPATRVSAVRSFGRHHGAYVYEDVDHISVTLIVRMRPIPFTYILTTRKANR